LHCGSDQATDNPSNWWSERPREPLLKKSGDLTEAAREDARPTRLYANKVMVSTEQLVSLPYVTPASISEIGFIPVNGPSLLAFLMRVRPLAAD